MTISSQTAPVSPVAVHAAGSSADALLDVLAQWEAQGWLRSVDHVFATFLARQVAAPAPHPLLLLGAALASHQLGRGHACLALETVLEDSRFALSMPPDGDARPGQVPTPADVLAGVSLPHWLDALSDERLVTAGEGDTPLVLAHGRLYLRRYWRHEASVKQALQARAAGAGTRPDPSRLRPLLQALFATATTSTDPDWQQLACALAASQPLTVITGGPGTGKTTTVLKLLALLLAQAADADQPLRIRLAAPTGKAAARLQESMAAALASLPWHVLPDGDAVRARMPGEVATLHRLLGRRQDSRQPHHHAGHRLPLDVLVVDEASMVDLEMMAAVLEALPDTARLVLLGDKDQLASVEAGAVLGELCARAPAAHYWPATRDWLQQATGASLDARWEDPDGTPLDQCVVMLRHSYRFDAGSGIGRLAAAVNHGDVTAAEAVWSAQPADLARLDPLADAAVWRTVLDGHAAALDVMRAHQPALTAAPDAWDAWAIQVLEAHGRFQLLCALRRGAWGVDGLNAEIAAHLQSTGRIAATQGWYEGRPVLVTRNDYGIGLMNGDIGMALPYPVEGPDGRHWGVRVAFVQGGRVRWVAPVRLQSVETVYAMTVHKSQGSEFAHVALVLPPESGPGLTRELLYTGLTRARERFTLVCPGGPAVWHRALSRRVQRASGLMA